MSLPFDYNEAYANADYAQQVVNRWQGNEYPTLGFGNAGSYETFSANYAKGFYQYENNLPGALPLVQNILAAITGQQASPPNRRGFGHGLQVLADRQAYSSARNTMLQRTVADTMHERAKRVAVQRNRFYGSEAESGNEAFFQSGFGSLAISMANATMPPEVFEGFFGSAGSGIGMFDAAYSQATYQINPDGTRWSPGQRARYAAQAMRQVYTDPAERKKRLFNSVEGGQIWSGLSSRGLLGGADADYLTEDEDTLRGFVLDYYKNNEISPTADSGTQATHERVHRYQEINEGRQRLARLQDVLSSSLGADQKLDAMKEFRQISGTLDQAEKEAGVTSHLLEQLTPENLGEASQALADLQTHQRTGRWNFATEEEYEAKTVELAKVARDAVQKAQIGSSDGTGIDLANLGQEELESLTASVGRAQGVYQQYQAAKQVNDSAITESDLTKSFNELAKSAGETFSKIANDQERADDGNSLKYNQLRDEVLDINRLKSQGASADEIASAIEKARTTAGNGLDADMVIRMFQKGLEGKDNRLSMSDAEDKGLAEAAVRTERRTALETAIDKYDSELSRGGLRSRKTDKLDLAELPLDELVDYSEAMLALQNDPRMSEYMQNAVRIKGQKGKFADWSDALRTLSDVMTDKTASPAQLMDTINAFAGGNMHQMDPVQMKHTIGKTYALARQLGQGDEYVARSMQNSMNMLGDSNVNRAFSGWHGMTGMALQAANQSNPIGLGMFGSMDVNELAKVQQTQLAAFIDSPMANAYAAAKRVAETDTFKTDSNTANWLKAMESGEKTFQYTDRKTGEVTDRSIMMSDPLLKDMMVADSAREDKAAMQSIVSASLRDEKANKQFLHELNDEELFKIQRSTTRNVFVDHATKTGVKLLTEGVFTEARNQLTQEGISAADSQSLTNRVERQTMERLFDEDTRKRVASTYNISEQDKTYAGKVSAILQMEELQRIVDDPNSSENDRKTASILLSSYSSTGQLDKNIAADEKFEGMAIVQNARLENIAKHTNSGRNMTEVFQIHGNTENAMKALRVAAADALDGDVLKEGFSASMMKRFGDALGSGADLATIMEKTLVLSDPNEHQMMQDAWDQYQGTKNNLLRIKDDISTAGKIMDPEKRQARIAELKEEEKTAQQNFADAAATQKRYTRSWSEEMDERLSSAELNAKFGMDLDLLNQTTSVFNTDTGQFELRHLKKDEVRHADDNSGRLEVLQDGKWQRKSDAAYFVRTTTQDENGQDIFSYKQLTHNGEAWTYKEDDGTVKEIDINAEENRGKFTVGTALLSKNDKGETYATNLIDIDGGLFKTDGMNASLATDATGKYITMDSDAGRALYLTSENGKINSDLHKSIENDTLGDVVTFDAKQLNNMRGSKRNLLKAIDRDSDEQTRLTKQIANRFVSSTGNVVQIDLEKIERNGNTFYMESGFESEEQVNAEEEAYIAEKTKQKSDISAYFESTDTEAAGSDLAQDSALSGARIMYRRFTDDIETSQAAIESLKQRIGESADPSKVAEYEKDIQREEARIGSLTATRDRLLDTASSQKARENRVKTRTDRWRDIAKEASQVAITDSQDIEMIGKYGGAAGKDIAETKSVTAEDAGRIIHSLKDKLSKADKTERPVILQTIEELEQKITEANKRAADAIKAEQEQQAGSKVTTMEGDVSKPARVDDSGNVIVETPDIKKKQGKADVPPLPTNYQPARPKSNVQYDAEGKPIGLLDSQSVQKEEKTDASKRVEEVLLEYKKEEETEKPPETLELKKDENVEQAEPSETLDIPKAEETEKLPETLEHKKDENVEQVAPSEPLAIPKVEETEKSPEMLDLQKDKNMEEEKTIETIESKIAEQDGPVRILEKTIEMMELKKDEEPLGVFEKTVEMLDLQKNEEPVSFLEKMIETTESKIAEQDGPVGVSEKTIETLELKKDENVEPDKFLMPLEIKKEAIEQEEPIQIVEDSPAVEREKSFETLKYRYSPQVDFIRTLPANPNILSFALKDKPDKQGWSSLFEGTPFGDALRPQELLEMKGPVQVDTTAGTEIATKYKTEEVKDVVLNASTVNLKVDSMELINGNIEVTGKGQGTIERGGTHSK